MYIGSETDCCAVSIITSLYNTDDAKRNMLEFCRSSSRPTYDYTGSRAVVTGYVITIAPLIIFTGVMHCKNDGSEDDEEDYTDDVMAGPNFSEFIKANGLGVVVQSPARYNVHNHPTHKCRVWVWAPDVKALTTWYTENKPK